MPVGAVSKGPRPAGTALAPLLPHNHPQQEQLQRQLQALHALSRLPFAKAPALLLHLFHNGPSTAVDLATALGWSQSATGSAIKMLSTGRFHQGRPMRPHLCLLWVEKLQGAPGTHLKVCLRPEAVQLCRDITGLSEPVASGCQD